MPKGKGILKELKCSSALREFTGEKKISRGDLTKLIWKHIKRKKLGSEEDGRIIRVDSKLKPLISKRLIAEKRKLKVGKKTHRIPAGYIFMTEFPGQMKKHLEA